MVLFPYAREWNEIASHSSYYLTHSHITYTERRETFLFTLCTRIFCAKNKEKNDEQEAGAIAYSCAVCGFGASYDDASWERRR